MTDKSRSLAALPLLVYRLLVQLAHGLRLAVAMPASVVTAPLVRALSWRRRRPAPGARAQVARAELAPTPVQLPDGPPAPDAHSLFGEREEAIGGCEAIGEVEWVEVAPEFSERMYATVFARLQRGPLSKLLDLRAAELITLDLFEHLARAWKAPPGTVPRLGILLGYDGWAVLHQVAARALQPIIDEGVAVETFYEQQIHSLPAWFSRGHVRHDDIRAVMDWLRTQWRATATWPAVLSTTAILVHAHAPVEDVPDLLIELAAIALSFGGMEAAEQAAGHARSALAWLGDKPSVARCRALRSLATATMIKGEPEVGLALLETAITMAVMIKNQVEEARALHQIGFHALRCGHFARAEDEFCRALGLLSDHYSLHLQATLHHDLAIALHAQSKNEDAEHHATEALALRWTRESSLAREDRALIARIRASRPAQLG
jgi:hypothetical protein